MRAALVRNFHLHSCWRTRSCRYKVLSAATTSWAIRLHTTNSSRLYPNPNELRCPRSLTTASTLPAPPASWIDRLPTKVQPYMHLIRADKPIGSALLFLPCTWSITMASYQLDVPFMTSVKYLGLFGIGAIIMRGAGCIINDMWDRKLDKAVERTKNRPLARGDITPVQAFGFLGIQLSAGLAVLAQLNWYSIYLGASSLSLVTIYPFMKRITYWPQAVLGLAFNWGALLGWSAVAGATDWSICLPLYAGSFCWTLVYDTIYAHQDKLDDVTVGIRSTALLFGPNSRFILSTLSASSLSLITFAGFLNANSLPFYAGVGVAAVKLARILRKTDFNSRESCWKGFVGCGWAGFWIWAGAMVDYGLLASGTTIPFII
ncbi:UbiA prenyltransferase family-domain-containing protein [Cristinia sonorae]|uniref:4-hydroxybenzoate polyprenyltransferase, mitochondrial n=1 Tax=Cristinia sonorae TaxID=1940300 RepID=A0A8K0UX82_9AGAR|nr:UbiA prenyltransferase family-domain-containing protein [Cristinia sonorae]